MLNFMRKQKKSLRWVWGFLLALIIVSLTSYLIPSTMDMGTVSLTGDVATVGSESISVREFQAAYSGYLQRMRGQLTPEIIKAFRFDKQVLDGLILQRVIESEAKRLNLDVAPAEIERTILENPAFREGANFIGVDRYQQMLGEQVEEYEKGIRLSLLQDKVRDVVTAAITVSGKDAESEYRRRNEKAKLDYFVIDPAKLESQVTTTEADLKDYYEKNKAKYTVSEKRKAKYLFISATKYTGLVPQSDDALKTYLVEHPDAASAAEEAVAQHILFKTEGKTPAEVDQIQEKARGVLDRVKKNEDFSQLARQFSEDPGSGSRGGNLGGFLRGDMVKEFDEEVFGKLNVGQVSDLVRTRFGFHIIKLLDKRPPRTRTFEEVKGNEKVRQELMISRGKQRALELATAAASEASTTKSLEKAAQKTGAGVGEIKETDFVEQTEPIAEVAFSQEFMTEIFRLAKDGDIGPMVETPVGFVIPMLAGIQPTHPGAFDEVRKRLQPDVKAQKAKELAVKKGEQAQELLRGGKDLASVAKTVGADVKVSDYVTRGGGLPEFGTLTDQEKEIFSLPIGKVGTPGSVSGKTLAFSVRERKDIDPVEMQRGLDSVRGDMLKRKRGEYFEAYVTDARKRMDDAKLISIDEATLETIAKSVS